MERGITGTAGTTSYTKTCPVNSAISGFRGRFSQYVDQLDFECRPLTSSGKLTGTGTFLGAVGPATGTAQGPWRCDSGNPGFALYGRSGSWMDNFGVQCRQATATFVNTPPSLANPGSQSTTGGLRGRSAHQRLGCRSATRSPSAPSVCPPGLSINSATGRITRRPEHRRQLRRGTQRVRRHGQRTSVNFSWTVTTRPPFTLDPLPPATPQSHRRRR